jgi:hypothetical protein
MKPGKKILFLETWLYPPHIETAFEITQKHLNNGDKVFFYFAGHDLPCQDGINDCHRQIFSCRPRWLPERRLARMVSNKNFYFKGRIRTPRLLAQFSEAPASCTELKAIEYKGSKIGLAALSSLIHETKLSEPDLIDFHDKVRTMLRSGAMAYDLASRLINKIKPDLVYVFNGRFVNCRSLLDACINHNVKYLIHERGHDRDHFSARPFMPHDFSQIQDEISKTWQSAIKIDYKAACMTARQFFENRRDGLDQGWFSFSAHQKSGLVPNLPVGKRFRITYFSSSDDEFKAVGDIVKWERWPDQVSAVTDLIKACRTNPLIDLVIRVHPHYEKKHLADRQFWNEHFIKEGITVIPSSSKVSSYELLETSDAVATTMSTMGIEAVHYNKPSICLGPSYYDQTKIIYKPRNIYELIELFSRVEELRSDQDQALPFGYYFNTFGVRFYYYRAVSLSAGTFMNEDVQDCPKDLGLHFKSRLKRKAHIFINSFLRLIR